MPIIFRPKTFDEDIWKCVNVFNEYKIHKNLLTDCTVLDVGAHIGGFSHFCLTNGSTRVVAVECTAPGDDEGGEERAKVASFTYLLRKYT